MKKYGLLAIAGILGLSACDDPFEGTNFVEPSTLEEEMSCIEVLESRKETYSLWLDMLRYADYYSTLKNVTQTAIVFAPTNEAVTEFLEWKQVDNIRDLDSLYVRSVVQSHILPASSGSILDIANLAEIKEAFPYKTLYNTNLVPSYGYINKDVDDKDRNDSVVYNSTYIYLNNQAQMAQKDGAGIDMVKANGTTIYTLNSVIRPLTETVVDKLDELGDYSIFVAAARESGYDKVAALVTDTVPVVGGGYKVNTYNYTCFAPCDEAFKKENINSLEDLKARIGIGDSVLYRYVAYHFMDQVYTKAKFFNFDSDDQTLIYDTNFKAQVVICKKADDGTPLINQCAKVLRSDIQARNGLIHKIDYYLPVWAPEPVEVRWDFCNSADIISFVNNYGTNKNLGDLYYTSLASKEYQIDLSSDYRDGEWGTITSFIYNATTSKASTSQYRRVGFKKCKYISSKDKEHNAYDAYLNNLLVLNLGFQGWIQFQTPTIIKGKYKVTLHYASEATMKSFHAAGSLVKFQLDPDTDKANSQNKYVFKGLPTTNYVYGSGDLVLWDEIDFEDSQSHAFKATMLDVNAKTNGTYHHLWDYVLFTPIED